MQDDGWPLGTIRDLDVRRHEAPQDQPSRTKEITEQDFAQSLVGTLVGTLNEVSSASVGGLEVSAADWIGFFRDTG